MQNGILAPIVDVQVTGDQRAFEANATDAEGRQVLLRGNAASIAPLRQRRDGLLTLVNEGLTRLQWNDRTALALSEWLVQTEA